METKDFNSIGLAYLEMVEKKNIEAKKNHANALHKNQKALDVHSDEDEDHNDDPTDGDGDIDAADLKKLRKDADKDDKKFDKKKKSSKKDDNQDKFKAYDGPDADGQQGAAIGEDAKYPHMMYDPKTGKEFKAETPADHEKYAKMGYTHDKPEEIDEAMTMVSRKPHPEGGHIVTLKDKNDKKVVRHLHNGKVKTISKESVEMSESVIIEAIDMDDAAFDKFIEHMTDEELQALEEGIIGGTARLLGKAVALPFKATAGAAKMAYRGGSAVANRFSRTGRADAMDRKVNKIVQKRIAKNDKAKKTEAEKARLNTSSDTLKTVRNDKNMLNVPTKPASRQFPNHGTAPNFTQFESVNVDDVLALIDQGYTLDQAEAMVAEACGEVNASRKQSKAGDNDRNMANDQRSIPAKGADTAPVRPGTKQQQRDFDKAARMAKSKDKVSVAKAPWDTKDEGFTSDAQRKAVWASKNDAKNEELHGNQHKLDHNNDNKIDAGDMKKVRKHGAVQKESVMDRVSNMVEDIRVNIQEDRDQDQEDRDNRAGPGGKYISYFDSDHAAVKKQLELGPKGKYKNAQKRIDAHTSGKKHDPVIADMISKRNKPNSGTNVVQMKRNVNELDKKTLGSYVKKAVPDMDTQSRFATEYEKRGMAAKNPGVMDKNFKKANRADDKVLNRRKGINTAIDKMTKESVQEAAKPTGIHHSTPVTAAQANDEQAAGRWTDKAGRNTMTEKEFVDMHTIHPDVLPEFDGNVAAKQTAEAIKKAPKVSPTPNKNPPAGDKKIVKSTEAPVSNAGVVGENYMHKYAKYIRGDK